MAVLGCLAKLKRGLKLAFGAHFLYDFSIKNVPYLILYQWTKFQYPIHIIDIHITGGVQKMAKYIVLSNAGLT